MNRALRLATTCTPPPAGAERGRPGPAPAGFSLVELLVVIMIILVLMALTGAAISGSRANQKRQSTLGLIMKIDAIVGPHFASYASRVVPPGVSAPTGMTPAIHRSWYVRRHMINGDLPDRWVDVKFMYDNSDLFAAVANPQFPKDRLSPAQRSYLATWHSMTKKPTDAFQGAECLFMIIMQGGIGSCLDCNELQDAVKGDKDNDGAFEFWDSWGNPIAFLLWAPALELPANSGLNFFSGRRALEIPGVTTGSGPPPAASPSPGLGMRPLIYSAGPDGEYGLETQAAASHLGAGSNPPGRDCGNWQASPAAVCGTRVGATDRRGDNVTNFDPEAGR